MGLKTRHLLFITKICVLLSLQSALAQDTSLSFYGMNALSADYKNHAARIDSLGIRWTVRDYDAHTQENMIAGAALHNNVILRLCRPDLVSDMNGWRAYVRSAVQTYGPGGTFWAAHPALPYMPVRYYQILEQTEPRQLFACYRATVAR